MLPVVIVLGAVAQLGQPLRQCYILPNRKTMCACGSQVTLHDPSQEVRPSEKVVMKDLALVEELAENLFEKGKVGVWNHTQSRAEDLVNAVCLLDEDAEGGKATATQLDREVYSLSTAAKQHKLIATMENANEITRIVSDLASAFHPTVPSLVEMLDYYGRKLEIEIDNRDLGALRSTTAELRKTWNQARDTVKVHGGSKTAAQFEQIVMQLEQANGISTYVPLAQAERRQADRVEAVFDGRKTR